LVQLDKLSLQQWRNYERRGEAIALGRFRRSYATGLQTMKRHFQNTPLL